MSLPTAYYHTLISCGFCLFDNWHETTTAAVVLLEWWGGRIMAVELGYTGTKYDITNIPQCLYHLPIIPYRCLSDDDSIVSAYQFGHPLPLRMCINLALNNVKLFVMITQTA